MHRTRCGARPPDSFSITRPRFIAGSLRLNTARSCLTKPAQIDNFSAELSPRAY